MNLDGSSLYSKVLLLCLGLITPFVSCEETAHHELIEKPAFELSQHQEGAFSGSAFANSIKLLNLEERESAIFNEVSNGNLPPFLRELVAIDYDTQIDGTMYNLTFFVMPDYISIGSDADHFLIPMTPILAQKILDQIGGVLPTRKMVDLIWEASDVKLTPDPIPPSTAMVTVEVFLAHNTMIESERATFIDEYPLGRLVAGHKKDVILSNKVDTQPDKVIIYGWHYPNGEPIQPLYSGHINWYADYSHGIRPVLRTCVLNDSTVDILDLLKNPHLFQLLSDESSVMEAARYDTSSSNYP